MWLILQEALTLCLDIWQQLHWFSFTEKSSETGIKHAAQEAAVSPRHLHQPSREGQTLAVTEGPKRSSLSITE